jgi:hypothetical protein
MQIQLPEEHQKQKLLFFLAQDVDDHDRKLLREMIERMSTSRSWVIGAPEFIDITENSETEPGDIPVETVGGVHEIYSTSNPNKLPAEIDAQHLDEVEYIVDSVRQLSQEHRFEFEFELDGQYVGTIDNGRINATLQIGLIEEWRSHVTAAK